MAKIITVCGHCRRIREEDEGWEERARWYYNPHRLHWEHYHQEHSGYVMAHTIEDQRGVVQALKRKLGG